LRLSTQSRYGLRALVVISREGDRPISCEKISEIEGISKKYLDRILGTLRQASLVESHRGQGGGYCLARPPDQIRLNEVVSVLENSFEIIPCLEDTDNCERSCNCRTRNVWRTVTSALENALEDITLADISGCRE